MPAYLNTTDIKSNLVIGVDLTPYLDETGQAIDDLAEANGVLSTSVSTPIHFQIKQYGINFLLMRVCEDLIGTVQPDTLQFDKYFQMADYYRKRVADCRNRIGAEMFTGVVSYQQDRSIRTGMLFRG
jgi:hypothetical protein